MSGDSSCRPDRLEGFEGALGDLADGLTTRAGRLADALALYRQACDPDYRAPTADSDALLRGLAGQIRDWGGWVGEVGRGFDDAGGDDGVVHASEEEVAEWLRDTGEAGDDPYRGIAPGAADQLALSLGETYDQDGPPAWVGSVSAGNGAADFASAMAALVAGNILRLPDGTPISLRYDGDLVRVLSDGRQIRTVPLNRLEARLRMPGAINADRLRTASRWMSRTGHVLAFTGGAADQWFSDEGASGVARTSRAVARGVGTAGFAAGGAYVGSMAGTACGPFMWACVPAGGFVGGLAGGAVGTIGSGWILDHLPGGPPSFEEVMAGDVDVAPSIERAVDLAAVDAAHEATADDPPLHARVGDLLAPGEAAFVADDQARMPDPWVRERAYE